MKNNHNPVTNPAHYTDGKIEVIDFIEDKALGFRLGNAVKYIARAGKKDPAKRTEDLQKAAWYLNREIEKAGGQPLSFPGKIAPSSYISADMYERKKLLIERYLTPLCIASNPFFAGLEYAVQIDNGAVQRETVTLHVSGAPNRVLDASRTSIANIAIAILQQVSHGN